MNVKRAVFAILVGGLILALSISRAVVDTSRIEVVHKKSVLTPQDLQIIDEFMIDAVGDIVNATNFTDVAKVRAIILNYQSTQAQYADQYSQSALRHISEGLRGAQASSDRARGFKVMTNLLILADSLKDPRLVDLAIGMIPHESSAVRYWAVRAAADPALWAKLSQDPTTATQSAGRILTECTQVVGTSSPEVLAVMAEFAGRYDTAQAEELLRRIADVRIAGYADWTVRYELMDIAVLRLLCDKITAGGSPNRELAKRFAQLYSFVVQRHVRGQRAGVLKELSRNYLASVIVEIEDKCLSKLLGMRLPALLKAVQDNNLDGLQAEHDGLLGGPNQAGTLVSKLSIDYGSAGNSRATPLPLPDPPQRKPAAETQPAAQP